MDQNSMPNSEAESPSKKPSMIEPRDTQPVSGGSLDTVRPNSDNVYSRYIYQIAPLVAKVEVYTHDLPQNVRYQIEIILQSLSGAAVLPPEKAVKIYEAVLKYETHLVGVLYDILIKVHIKSIKRYKRFFKKFNYKSVKIANTEILVMKKISDSLTDIVAFHRSGRRNLSSIEDLDLATMINHLKLCGEVDIANLERSFKLAEETLEICENNYPGIVNNGYNSSFIARVVSSIPEIVTAALTIIAFISLVFKFIV